MRLGGEFDAVAACVRTSALFRAADSIATACLTAADRSAVAARVRDARARFASLPGDGRLRAVAICVATAAAGHLMLLLQFGSMGKELAAHNTRLFADQVLPQLKGLFGEWEDRWWPQPMARTERAELPAIPSAMAAE